MSATERLRELLDERGVEWQPGDSRVFRDSITYWTVGKIRWSAIEGNDGLVLNNIELDRLTPEQVIDSTLGGDGKYELKMDSLLCRLTNGLYSKTRAYSLDFMESCVTEAFAATLGPGTCELHDCEGSFYVTSKPVWRCDCGAFMTQYTDTTTYHKPRFCPNCGRRCIG